MNDVLIDNWTLHNVAYAMTFPKSARNAYKELENLLMAILLWDNIYSWSNGNDVLWKSAFGEKHPLPIKDLELPQYIKDKIVSIADDDIIGGGALRYQTLATELHIDYLAEQNRFAYLHSNNYSQTFNSMMWQKYIIDCVDKEIQEYYQSLEKLIGNIELKFHFPLLLDYFMGETMDETNRIWQCLNAAIDARNSKEFCDMRKWISDLHTYIDNGNWTEVEHSIKDVKDIVSSITCGNTISEVQIAFPPSISASVPLKKIMGHKTQLTFLRNLSEFALKKRSQR